MDISISPYQLSFDDICSRAGDWIESVYTFQWERLNNRQWDFSFFPNIERFSMGRGSGLISRDIVSFFDSNSKPHVYLFDTFSQLVLDLIIDHRCNHVISQPLSNDSVAVLTDDGVFFYYQCKQLTLEYDLRIDNNSAYVMAADFWDNGFVCLLTNGDLIEALKFTNHRRIRHFDEIGEPDGFYVIPPEKSPIGKPIVYILKQGGKLLIASEDQCFCVELENKITNISLSASFTKIAILTENLNLVVASSDMTEMFYKRPVESNGFFDVLNLSWVGDIAPVICFKGAVVLGTNDSTGQAMWSLDNEEDFSYGFTDVDSCLICTSGPTYRLVYVPDNIARIFNERIDPNYARKLCLIYSNRLKFPPVQAIASIGTADIVQIAAKDCLETAEYFTTAEIQDYFLNSACFALTYIGKTNPLFESVTRIKILNQVRKIANLPVTASQIFAIGIDALLMRLMTRELHFLAIDIAHILHLPITHIQKQYIERTVHTLIDDEACINTIKDHDGIDYGYAAVCAAQNKRRKLALEFCKLEPHFSRKALIFAQIGEWAEALTHADASCDGSALFNVLVMMFESSEIEAVNLAVAQNEVASMFIVNNYGFIDEERTQAIMQLIDPKATYADAKLRASSHGDEIAPPLQNVLKPLIKLKEFQKPLASKKNDPSIVGMTFNDTIRNLINIADYTEAFALAKSCGVPRVNVAVIAIQHLSYLGRWNRLNSFILHKEWSSLWPLVVEIALAYHNEDFAKSFVEEAAAHEHNKDLAIQLENGAFGVSNLEKKASYQKKLFRKSFFKPFGL